MVDLLLIIIFASTVAATNLTNVSSGTNITTVPTSKISTSFITPTTNSPTAVTALSTTTPLCQNGGQLDNGLCICPNDYTGTWCQIHNFCSKKQINKFTFPQTSCGLYSYSIEICPSNTPNAGFPQASVLCLNQSFGTPTQLDCTQTLDTIHGDLSQSGLNKTELAFNTQILTSRPNQLTSHNISTAAEIASSLLSLQDISEDAKQAAVSTVSQLLNAGGNKFSNSTRNSTNRLVQTLQVFSLSGNSMVQPNVVVQSAKVKVTETAGVKFSAFRGLSDNFSPNRINLSDTAANLQQPPTDVQMTINFKTDSSPSSQYVNVGIVLYNNDHFFESRNFQSSLNTQTKVIYGNLTRTDVIDHVNFSVSKDNMSKMFFHDFACVTWDVSKTEWKSDICRKVLNGPGRSDVLTCHCKNTANFAVLMVRSVGYLRSVVYIFEEGQFNEYMDHVTSTCSFSQDFSYSVALDIISISGCSLSIVGLSITAVFQILTRKSRQMGPTLLLVSICLSTTTFYFLFIFGINNPVQQIPSPPTNNNEIPASDLYQAPDSGPCTAFTALLQYFLLATFTWSTLYAIHIYLLIRNGISGPPQGFHVFSITVGWGLPAIIVGISLGIMYRMNSPLGYRQEEFCWLAGFDINNRFDPRKPLLWGFLLPLCVMLLINFAILIYFSFTTCRPSPNLNSSRVTPFRKKILSSFSLAVVLGVSWIIGYFMLLTTEPILHTILTFVFCICNATQGIQIFVLFTVRTSFFKQNVLVLVRAISPPEVAIHKESYWLWRVKKNDPTYPERYTSNDFDLPEEPAPNTKQPAPNSTPRNPSQVP
ncbi:adhesion G-protein coupled receptor G7 [Brachyhypopomus gauderio]|uniref:adhesion G-protein coupled receptor G7 n=1 Tax=Brachyhypopomus gauderio TaxID=698409 RepID=UPI00404172E6